MIVWNRVLNTSVQLAPELAEVSQCCKPFAAANCCPSLSVTTLLLSTLLAHTMIGRSKAAPNFLASSSQPWRFCEAAMRGVSEVSEVSEVR